MLSPSAFLHDFITDPDREKLSLARRMVVKLTGRIPDLYRAADVHERMAKHLKDLVSAREALPDFSAFHEVQSEARACLVEVERMGRQ